MGYSRDTRSQVSWGILSFFLLSDNPLDTSVGKISSLYGLLRLKLQGTDKTELMAEVLGLVGVAASVGQLVQISGTVLISGYGFLLKVTREPSEMRELLAERAGLNCVLGQLQSLVDSPTSPDDALIHYKSLAYSKNARICLCQSNTLLMFANRNTENR